MNLFICGQKSFGKAVMIELYDRGHNIVGIAPPPQEKYYDKMVGPAQLRGIPIISNLDRLVSADIPNNTDLIIAAHSHFYISDKVIEKAKYGGIGFHPSLLPRHRGRDAIRWAVAMGDAISGCSIYWIDQKVDGGDILVQKPIFIDRSWNYHDLWNVMFPVGVKLLCDSVDKIAAGEIERYPQNERFATWEPAWENNRLKRNELLQLMG